ncbi:unnamed protein product [Leuciscus chuanchicus]
MGSPHFQRMPHLSPGLLRALPLILVYIVIIHPRLPDPWIAANCSITTTLISTMLRYLPNQLLELNTRLAPSNISALKQLGILRRPCYVHRGSRRRLVYSESITESSIPSLWTAASTGAHQRHHRMRHQSARASGLKNYNRPHPGPLLEEPRTVRPVKRGVDSTVLRSLVETLIHSMRPSTCSLDPLPTALIKSNTTFLSPLITTIINSSLHSGHLPISLKTALINPRLKKPSLDPDILSNYRPISNLPFLSKVIEKVIVTQIHNNLHSHSLYEKFQSGFRSAHSTETALVRVTNYLLVAADQGSPSLLLLLDLSAAFDTVDHTILLHRLQYFIGISHTAFQWFRSYLTDRVEYMRPWGEPGRGPTQLHVECLRVRSSAPPFSPFICSPWATSSAGMELLFTAMLMILSSMSGWTPHPPHHHSPL